MEEEKPPQHNVLLVAEIFHRPGDLGNDQMLFRYEDLKRDQEGMLRKIADFTGFVLTEDQIQVLQNLK